MRHLGAVVFVVTLVAGCGSAATTGSPPPSAVVAAPSATALVAAPSSTPAAATLAATPTPIVHVIADLVADPLPAANAASVLALDPGTKAIESLQGAPFKGCGCDGPPDLYPAALWLCTAALRTEPTTERLLDHETACLLAISSLWQRYLRETSDSTFAAPRTAYAYAARSLGPTGRAFVDKTLSAMDWTWVGASPTSLRTTAQMLAEPIRPVTTGQLFAAVRDAIATNPLASLPSYAPLETVKVYSSASASATVSTAVNSTIDLCARPHLDPSGIPVVRDQMDSGCHPLAGAMWLAYKATGDMAFYRATVIVYQYGYSQFKVSSLLKNWAAYFTYAPF
jgi:hypothetical protein